MNKPIIGIICQPDGFSSNDVFKPRYYILNTYTKSINNNGGIPIGIVMNNLDVMDDTLELCDGFLITGGSIVKDYHLKIIDYALKAKKPLLGICMGMQALAMHSLHTLEEYDVLKKVGNHNHTNHIVNIMSKNSHVYKVFKKNRIEVNSYHNYCVEKIGDCFEICGYSPDNIPEIIEHKDKNIFVVGVQWHPELMDKMSPLIQKFIEEAGKRYEN